MTGMDCWIFTSRMFNYCLCHSFCKKLNFVQRLCELRKGGQMLKGSTIRKRELMFLLVLSWVRFLIRMLIRGGRIFGMCARISSIIQPSSLTWSWVWRVLITLFSLPCQKIKQQGVIHVFPQFLWSWLVGEGTKKQSHGWLHGVCRWFAIFMFGWAALWSEDWRYGHASVIYSGVGETRIYFLLLGDVVPKLTCVTLGCPGRSTAEVVWSHIIEPLQRYLLSGSAEQYIFTSVLRFSSCVHLWDEFADKAIQPCCDRWPSLDFNDKSQINADLTKSYTNVKLASNVETVWNKFY